MRTSDALAIAVSALVGAVTGWLIAESVGAVIGTTISVILAYVGVRANIRPGVVSTVLVGTMAGGLIGSSVVEAICLPASCRPLTVAGGLITAALSFVGVGLVAALVTRSFDEYNERIAAGLPPTGVGCEGGDTNRDKDTDD
ncbi:MAG: hypothetical protein BMS9Abin12_0567 [Acidimicrobiia bacterium]|nr:MAG: hypothetical protein BMS9Abin12_0567 [Acidimicrobiia bacterium]